MARLTLTEGGASRRFKLSNGKATIGSGPEASLRLDSDGVADVHAELAMTEDGLVVRTKKGVLPPTAGGQPIPDEYVMKDGQPLLLGDASLVVEYEDGEGPVAAPAPAAVSRTSRAGGVRRSSGGSSRRSRAAADDLDDDEPRSRRRVQRKSDPTGLLIAGAVGILIVGFAWFLLSRTAKGLSGQDFNYDTEFRRAKAAAEEDGSTFVAIQALNKILKEPLTVEQNREASAYLAELQDRSAENSDIVRNQEGTQFLQKRVDQYSKDHPVMEERSYALAFLSRADWFLDNWPTHPERSRVESLMERVRSIAKPTEPMSTADLDVVVKAWSAISPPEFYEAYEIVDTFLAKETDEAARTRAQQIRREIDDAQDAYAEKKFTQAKQVYSNDPAMAQFRKPGQALFDVASILARCPSSVHRAQAAKSLVLIKEIQPRYMREQFKIGRPLFWERMISEPTFRAWAEQNGML